MGFSLAATDSGPLYTSVFYCGENIFSCVLLVGSVRIGYFVIDIQPYSLFALVER